MRGRILTILPGVALAMLAAGCVQYPVYSQLPYDYEEGYGGGVYDPGYHGTAESATGDHGVDIGLGLYGGSVHQQNPWIYPWYHLPYYHTHTFASPYYPRYPLGPQNPWVFPYAPGNVAPGIGAGGLLFEPPRGHHVGVRGNAGVRRHESHPTRSSGRVGATGPRTGTSRAGSRSGVSASRGFRAPAMRAGPGRAGAARISR